MKAILSHPALYQAYQNAGGFFGARVKAIADYLTLRSGMLVIDIGCGPGYILRHLPPGIDYIGFDIDQAYIEHAQRAFGHLGKFHCRCFDAAAASEFAGADVVMMNGVLHHIADKELNDTLANVRNALKSDGVLFTLDGCYREGYRQAGVLRRQDFEWREARGLTADKIRIRYEPQDRKEDGPRSTGEASGLGWRSNE